MRIIVMNKYVMCIAALAAVSGLGLDAQLIEGEAGRQGLRAAMEQALMGPFEPLVGLTGPVVPHRPYSATVTTETTQTLAGGAHIRQQAGYRIARDAAGRIRQENTATGKVFLSDPVEGATYLLDSQARTARKLPLGAVVVPESAANNYLVRRPDGSARRLAYFPPGESKDAARSARKEDLGTQNIGGIAARGERTTVTLPAGSVGNNVPLLIVQERWYSADLEIAVMTHHTDPRTGETTVRYTEVHRGDPDPARFQVPAGYRIQ
jgi:hypothetical protein